MKSHGNADPNSTGTKHPRLAQVPFSGTEAVQKLLKNFGSLQAEMSRFGQILHSMQENATNLSHEFSSIAATLRASAMGMGKGRRQSFSTMWKNRGSGSSSRGGSGDFKPMTDEEYEEHQIRRSLIRKSANMFADEAENIARGGTFNERKLRDHKKYLIDKKALEDKLEKAGVIKKREDFSYDQALKDYEKYVNAKNTFADNKEEERKKAKRAQFAKDNSDLPKAIQDSGGEGQNFYKAMLVRYAKYQKLKDVMIAKHKADSKKKKADEFKKDNPDLPETIQDSGGEGQNFYKAMLVRYAKYQKLKDVMIAKYKSDTQKRRKEEFEKENKDLSPKVLATGGKGNGFYDALLERFAKYLSDKKKIASDYKDEEERQAGITETSRLNKYKEFLEKKRKAYYEINPGNRIADEIENEEAREKNAEFDKLSPEEKKSFITKLREESNEPEKVKNRRSKKGKDADNAEDLDKILSPAQKEFSTALVSAAKSLNLAASVFKGVIDSLKKILEKPAEKPAEKPTNTPTKNTAENINKDSGEPKPKASYLTLDVETGAPKGTDLQNSRDEYIAQSQILQLAVEVKDEELKTIGKLNFFFNKLPGILLPSVQKPDGTDKFSPLHDALKTGDVTSIEKATEAITKLLAGFDTKDMSLLTAGSFDTDVLGSPRGTHKQLNEALGIEGLKRIDLFEVFKEIFSQEKLLSERTEALPGGISETRQAFLNADTSAKPDKEVFTVELMSTVLKDELASIEKQIGDGSEGTENFHDAREDVKKESLLLIYAIKKLRELEEKRNSGGHSKDVQERIKLSSSSFNTDTTLGKALSFFNKSLKAVIDKITKPLILMGALLAGGAGAVEAGSLPPSGQDNRPVASRTARVDTPKQAATRQEVAKFGGRSKATVIKVIDGDTIDVRIPLGENQDVVRRVRLSHIDAPETAKDATGQHGPSLGQPGGEEARKALEVKILGQDVELDVTDVDVYGRRVGTIIAGDRNINEEMVAEGNATASRYLGGRTTPPNIQKAEATARKDGAGIHSTNTPAISPTIWQKGMSLSDQQNAIDKAGPQKRTASPKTNPSGESGGTGFLAKSISGFLFAASGLIAGIKLLSGLFGSRNKSTPRGKIHKFRDSTGTEVEERLRPDEDVEEFAKKNGYTVVSDGDLEEELKPFNAESAPTSKPAPVVPEKSWEDLSPEEKQKKAREKAERLFKETYVALDLESDPKRQGSVLGTLGDGSGNIDVGERSDKELDQIQKYLETRQETLLESLTDAIIKVNNGGERSLLGTETSWSATELDLRKTKKEIAKRAASKAGTPTVPDSETSNTEFDGADIQKDVEEAKATRAAEAAEVLRKELEKSADAQKVLTVQDLKEIRNNKTLLAQDLEQIKNGKKKSEKENKFEEEAPITVWEAITETFRKFSGSFGKDASYGFDSKAKAVSDFFAGIQSTIQEKISSLNKELLGRGEKRGKPKDYSADLEEEEISPKTGINKEKDLQDLEEMTGTPAELIIAGIEKFNPANKEGPTEEEVKSFSEVQKQLSALIGAFNKVKELEELQANSSQEQARMSLEGDVIGAQEYPEKIASELSSARNALASTQSSFHNAMDDASAASVSPPKISVPLSNLGVHSTDPTIPVPSNKAGGGTAGATDPSYGADTSRDTIPAMLTPGEKITNAQASKKNAGLLDFINKHGKNKKFSLFASGGTAGGAGGSSGGSSRSTTFGGRFAASDPLSSLKILFLDFAKNSRLGVLANSLKDMGHAATAAMHSLAGFTKGGPAFDTLTGSLEILQMSIGISLTPIILRISQVIQNFASQIENGTGFFGGLVKAISSFIDSISDEDLNLIATLGMLASGMVALAPVFSILMGAITFFATAVAGIVTLLTSPILVLVGGILGAVAYFGGIGAIIETVKFAFNNLTSILMVGGMALGVIMAAWIMSMSPVVIVMGLLAAAVTAAIAALAWFFGKKKPEETPNASGSGGGSGAGGGTPEKKEEKGGFKMPSIAGLLKGIPGLGAIGDQIDKMISGMGGPKPPKTKEEEEEERKKRRNGEKENLLISSKSLRAQPSYSSIDEAYKKIQVSALGTDPIEAKKIALSEKQIEVSLQILNGMNTNHNASQRLANNVNTR